MSEDRLSELKTSWTTIRNAHGDGPEAHAAMSELIARYLRAVETYLRLKLHDHHLADEVLQDFWTKLLERKLAGADDTKGRFRDYLRTVLHRLIIDHFRAKKFQPLPPGDLLDPSMPDKEYDQVWRKTVINRVLTRLWTFEACQKNNRYASVFKLRMDHPKASIEELAALLSEKQGAPVSSDAFRKTLQRARCKFLEFLIEELRTTIHPATDEDVIAEIYDLGLGSLYRRYGHLLKMKV